MNPQGSIGIHRNLKESIGAQRKLIGIHRKPQDSIVEFIGIQRRRKKREREREIERILFVNLGADC